MSVIVAGTVMSGAAMAHQTFLLPGTFESAVGETVNVSMTSALSFPNMEHGPTKDRIAFAQAIIGSESISDFVFEESDTALNIGFSTGEQGVAMVAVSSKPRAGEIPPEDVGIYLDEIEAADDVRAAFEALPGSPPLQRSYAKHAKTFVCIANCDDTSVVETPIGQKLEFVAAGENGFRLLLDGAPLAGKQVTIVPMAGESLVTESEENGMVRLNDTTGVVMLTAVWITLPDSPDGVYHSDYATLTIDLNKLP